MGKHTWYGTEIFIKMMRVKSEDCEWLSTNYNVSLSNAFLNRGHIVVYPRSLSLSLMKLTKTITRNNGCWL